MHALTKYITKRTSMNHNYISVTQINKYIKYVIDNDKNLNTIYLKGEISNFKNHTDRKSVV